jgi:hypothetical protein
MSATLIGTALHATGWLMPMKITAAVVCLCGTPLRARAGHWDCHHCGRAFCRECGGPMTRNGGCDVCTVCGSGMCG